MNPANKSRKLREIFKRNSDKEASNVDVEVDGDLLEVTIELADDGIKYCIQVPYEEDRIVAVYVNRQTLKRWKAEFDFGQQVMRRASSGERKTKYFELQNQ